MLFQKRLIDVWEDPLGKEVDGIDIRRVSEVADEENAPSVGKRPTRWRDLLRIRYGNRMCLAVRVCR